jgi:fumarylacetoacetate (FAA) hydrolase
MKLATYKDGSRDGLLVVVSRDLAAAHYAAGIATRLQQALDDWNFIGPQLHDLYETLNAGRAHHAFAFDATQCVAPLPRAYQWVSNVRNSSDAERGATDPMMSRHASDDLFGACDNIVCAGADSGVEFESQVCVVTGDVGSGTTADVSLEGVRLLMIANAFSLRPLVAAEHCGPTTSFSPVAVTPDELGDAWRAGRVHLKLQTLRNGQAIGHADVAPEMRFHFGEMIAQLCETRIVRAGSIVGSGALSTASVHAGDTVRIELLDADGRSVCGAIEQRIVRAPAATARR